MPDSCQKPWLKYYSEATLKSTLPSWDKSLGVLLDAAAEKYPNRPAIVCDAGRLNYADFRKKALNLAQSLHKLGLTEGSKLAIMLPNLPEMILAFWGAIKAAAILVLINPLYREKELLHNLNDASVDYIIIAAQQWPMMAKLRDKLPVKKYIILE
ncbi:MAG: acyl--CoA ligase, partial [Desulfovibrionaceae bacterium]|nr:acyl--CoA ligase [Desulfovibrionaceae bacterium]